MIKKTLFQRSYNFYVNLLLLAVSLILINLVIVIVTKYISGNPEMLFANLLTSFSDNLDNVSGAITIVVTVVVSILTLAVSFEFFQRLRNDKIINWFKSIVKTARFRGFLRQRENSVNENSTEAQGNLNPILSSFNKAVSKSVIDIKEEKVLVYIPVPRNQQAQKKLQDMENQIKIELESQNPDYYFTEPVRIKNKLWFKGDRKV